MARYKISCLFISLIMLCGLTLSGCKQDNLLEDMASFDSSYVPVLYYTSQGDYESSREAAQYLVTDWIEFRQKYSQAKSIDPVWEKDFAKIDSDILEAVDILRGDTNIESAHEKLEDVRIILLGLRRRNEIDYFPDYLTTFHTTMEQILETVSGKTPSILDDIDIIRLQELTLQAEKNWKEVRTAQFDEKLFRFDEMRLEKFKQNIKDEALAVAELQNALMSQDKAHIIESAKALKPKFAEVYLLFGNFQHLER